MASGVRRREVTFGDVVEFCRHRGPRPRALQASRPASRPAKIDGCRNHFGLMWQAFFGRACRRTIRVAKEMGQQEREQQQKQRKQPPWGRLPPKPLVAQLAEHPQKHLLIGGFACHLHYKLWEFWLVL